MKDTSEVASHRTTLHALIETQVARSPGSTAVSIDDQHLDFADLNARANQLARHLKDLGVGPGAIVGVMLDRSLDLMVALLAILKAGGAYLPIDTGHPTERKHFILGDADVGIVLTHTEWRAELSGFDGECVCLDAIAAATANLPRSNPEATAGPDDLAYVIYTSGSTGQPKGCMIEHAAIANRLLWMQRHYGVGPGDHILQKTPFTFDVSVWELFLPLLTGARVVLARPGGHQDSSYLIQTIVHEGVTLCHFVPSMLRFFLRHRDVGRCGGLRAVFASGEALPFDLLKAFKHVLPRTELHNLYGPTEAAVDVSYWRCEERDDRIVPIGRAIDNLLLHIFDAEGKPAGLGETGELCIAGVGVGRGYLNRADLTAERFIPDPWGAPGARMYRTGDQARWLGDGNIEFLGRNDSQVKVRGLRIELGEIEAAVMAHRGVAEVAVVVQEASTVDPKVVAYVVPATGSIDVADVRQFVLQRLPRHMAPNAIIPLARLPVTAHGKLDHTALPWPVNTGAPERRVQEPGPPAMVEDARAWLADVLGAPTVSDADNLFDLGATSLTLVQLVDRMEGRHGHAIPVDVFLDDPTLAGLSRHLAAAGRLPAQNTAVPHGAARDLLADISAVIRPLLDLTELAPDDNLFDLGATSLTLVQIVDRLAERLGVDIPVDAILDEPTLGGMVAFAQMRDGRTPTSRPCPPLDAPCSTGPDAQIDVGALEDVDPELDDGQSVTPSPDFAAKPLESGRLGEFLGLLAGYDVKGRRRFLHPSSGDLNAIQTYAFISPGRITGVAPGFYYHHPLRHALAQIGDATDLDLSAFDDADGDIIRAAGAVILLVAELRAIEPIYGEGSEHLLEVEAGYITQLLLNRQDELLLSVWPCPVGPSDRLRSQLDLTESQYVLAAIAIGPRAERGTGDRGSTVVAARRTAPARQRPEWTSGERFSPQLVEQIDREARHLRELSPDVEVSALSAYRHAHADIAARASQRIYATSPRLERRQLAALLQLLSPSDRLRGRQQLFAEVPSAPQIEVLVFVREDRINHLEGGLYAYQPATRALKRLSALDAGILEACLTPFNRRHFSAAAFSVFLIARPGGDSGARARAWRQVGHIGQVFMERQAGLGVGLCPIGGLRVERWRTALGLGPDVELLHSFFGGGHVSGATSHRKRRRFDQPSEAPAAAPTTPNDVAIIGLSGRYPAAETPQEMWDNLIAGVVSIRPLPKGRFSGFETECRGGFLDDVEVFDNLLFNLSGREARSMDPQERQLLETAWEGLEDAGYTPAGLRELGRVGVFVGAMWNDYHAYGVESAANGAPIEQVAVAASLANRLSFFFDFDGPSIAINTSCSSSISALQFACDSLRSGRCDVALVAGVNLITHPHHLRLLADLGFLSKQSVGRPFSAEADGWIVGEGVGVLVLKPRMKAEHDGDHVYGHIKGTALGHSGRTFQFGAPDIEARARSIRDAIEAAGLAPGDIGYIESAASGASIADAAEMSALTAVFAGSAPAEGHRYIGSIKGNIGHLEAAAGLSQITKVLLQLQARTIAPTVGSEPTSPLLKLEQTGLRIATSKIPWEPLGGQGAPLRALVNVFGATGSAGHVILEQVRSRSDAPEPEAPVVVPLSAASPSQLREVAARLLERLRGAGVRLSDVAFTLQHGRVALKHRIAFVASDGAGLCQMLEAFCRGQRVHDDRVADAGLQRTAQTWMAGGEVDWTEAPTKGRRIVLPFYPFDRTLRAVACAPPTPSDARGRPPAEPGPAAPGETQAVESYLTGLLAEVAEIPAAAIDVTASLETYGISSGMIHLLNARLEASGERFPKTLFFEHRSLRALAQHLVRRHSAAIARAAGLQPIGTVEPSRSPTAGAGDQPVPRLRPTQRSDDRVSREIAIIGLAGRYPMANSLAQFWQNLKAGRDCITEIPATRWDHRTHYSADRSEPGRTYSRWGGFIDGVDEFDPLFFRISPREAETMDPQERLFLMTAHQAVEDAGYCRASLAADYEGRVGVFVGVMYSEYQLLGGLSSFGSIANRVSFALDLNGPSMAVDTMCSASMTAVHLAVQSLRCGESRVAIAGGVNLSLHPSKYLVQAQLNMLSSDGRCRSFGQGGDGMTPGEGVGALVLKPLADALADCDHIYGVIKATSVNHGGQTLGYTVPNPKGQAHLIARALDEAGVSSSAISYVEAHGTGTSLGDPIEIAALSSAFANDDGSNAARPTCAIGSVKSNIGHLEAAAGVAGITKVLLQMKHATLVPSLHSSPLNPAINFADDRFRVQTALGEWVSPQGPRLAGVSSFGAGGANAHMILGEAPAFDPAPRRADVGAVPIVLSARSEARLKAYARQLLAHLSADGVAADRLIDLAYTLQTGRDPMEARLAFLARDVGEVRQKLTAFVEGVDEIAEPGVFRGTTSPHREAMGALSADQTFRTAADAWIVAGETSKLLDFWVKGYDLDWPSLYRSPGPFAHSAPRRLSLPTYPFETTRYWVADASPPPELTPPPSAIRALNKAWRGETFEATPAADRYIILADVETLSLARALVQAAPGSRVVDWSDVSDRPADAATLAGLSGWIDLIGCGQSLAHDHGWLPYLQLWIEHAAPPGSIVMAVSRGLEAFENPEVNLRGADRAGLYRMISSEHRNLRSVHFDLDPHTDDTTAATLVLREIATNRGEVEVCERRGRRFCAHLADMERAPSTGVSVPSADLSPDEVLLVTGGTRGLGLLCARHWVRHHGAKTVVLMGQTPVPPRDAWSRTEGPEGVLETIRAVEALEATGVRVEVLTTPLADAAALRNVVVDLTTRLGRIGGVLHCAGRVDGAVPAFGDKSITGFEAVFAPKVRGLDALLHAVEREPLRFFVMFSSIAAAIPSLAVGLSDYAAANAYMDYVATRHAGRLPILSIQWPNWAETGMGRTTSSVYRDLGFRSLTDAEGLRWLDDLLSVERAPVIAAAAVGSRDWSPDELLRPARARVVGDDDASRGRTSDAPTDGADLIAWLRAVVARTLKIDAEKIDPRTALHEYGADSILLLQILRPVRERVGERLDPSILLQHPSLEEFAGWLLRNHGAALARSGAPDGRTHAADPVVREPCAPTPAPETREPATPKGGRRDVAVVGLSCRLPGAADADGFWALLKAGRSALRKADVRWGQACDFHAGLLEPTDPLDPAMFQVSDLDARAMDPQAFMVLEEALKTFCHAGYSPAEIKCSPIGVYLGARSDHRPRPEDLAASTHPAVAVGPNFLASNVSRAFDLKGPSLVVDTACSSALVCLHLACQAIATGDIDSALVGGVSHLASADAFTLFGQRGLLNRGSELHLFDGRASGAILAEGAGMVWLKPLEAALSDGDVVYAVVKGTAINNDGRTASPAAPNFQAQRGVMRAALARSGRAPSDVSYVEVSGSGSEITDLLELKAIEAELRPDGNAPCELGSPKPNIGHPLCAEGVAALVKVVLMLHHRATVPFLSAAQPMAHYDLEASPFHFARQHRSWDADEIVASVNCFADGGTNACAVLEAANPARATPPSRRPKPLPADARRVSPARELPPESAVGIVPRQASLGPAGPRAADDTTGDFWPFAEAKDAPSMPLQPAPTSATV